MLWKSDDGYEYFKCDLGYINNNYEFMIIVKDDELSIIQNGHITDTGI